MIVIQQLAIGTLANQLDPSAVSCQPVLPRVLTPVTLDSGFAQTIRGPGLSLGLNGKYAGSATIKLFWGLIKIPHNRKKNVCYRGATTLDYDRNQGYNP